MRAMACSWALVVLGTGSALFHGESSTSNELAYSRLSEADIRSLPNEKRP